MSNSPVSHVERFVGHYKDMGAARIRIFYDREEFAGSPDCEIVLCDDTFWKSLKKEKQFSVEDRQRDIYQHAYETAKSDWMLVVDIDELIFGSVALKDYLAKVDTRFPSVRFMPAEAVFRSIDDIERDFGATSFRLPYPSCFSIPMSHVLYPGLGQVFIRGLLGHSRGKYAFRTGYSDVMINIHEATRAGAALPELNASSGRRRDERLFLAHFDAISITQWREKWRRRLLKNDTKEMGAKRDRQMELFRAYDAQGRSEMLFHRLYGIGDLKLRLLKCLGLALDGNPMREESRR